MLSYIYRDRSIKKKPLQPWSSGEVPILLLFIIGTTKDPGWGVILSLSQRAAIDLLKQLRWIFRNESGDFRGKNRNLKLKNGIITS
jgi:hypothetical protein